MIPAAADLPTPAPLWRRLAAASYDGMLFVALVLVITGLDVLVREATGLPYSKGALRGAWFLGGLAYFGWFWTRGGGTPGLRAWRLRLRRTDGAPLGWPTACLRYALAWPSWLLLGAGVLWSAADPRRQSAHDRLSGTELVLTPASSRTMESI